MGKYEAQAQEANAQLDRAIAELESAKTLQSTAVSPLSSCADALAIGVCSAGSSLSSGYDGVISSINQLKNTILAKARAIDARIEAEAREKEKKEREAARKAREERAAQASGSPLRRTSSVEMLK